MSEGKHTKGPWKTEEQWSGGPLVSQIARFGRAIYVVATDLEAVPASDAEANARLIAAAPDLLETLDNLLHAYSEPDRRLCCEGRDCGCMGATVHQEAEHYARKAIARAEGRSNA